MGKVHHRSKTPEHGELCFAYVWDGAIAGEPGHAYMCACSGKCYIQGGTNAEIEWDVSGDQMHTTWSTWQGNTDVCVVKSEGHISVVPSTSVVLSCIESTIDEAGYWWVDGNCVVMYTSASGPGGTATFALRATEDPQGDCTSGWSRTQVLSMSHAII